MRRRDFLRLAVAALTAAQVPLLGSGEQRRSVAERVYKFAADHGAIGPAWGHPKQDHVFVARETDANSWIWVPLTGKRSRA